MPLVASGIGLENDHTVIAAAVGHIEFARDLVDDHVGRRSEIFRVIAAAIFAGTAYLHKDLPLGGVRKSSHAWRARIVRCRGLQGDIRSPDRPRLEMSMR